MKFDNWINSRKGKKIDYDGHYGVQCCDLANDYFTNVHGIPSSALFCFANAINYFTDFKNYSTVLQKKFKAVKNTPSYVPKKGVVAIFKGHGNGIGHISVCTGEGNTSYFYSYDQNWTGQHDACTKVKHDYSDIAGFLEPIDRSNIDVKLVMDTSGAKYGDKSLGILSFKMLLLLAYDLKLTKYKVAKDNGFGTGTKNAVNELLGKWGYQPNGIAGSNFIKRLHTEIAKKK
ncbi:MAG: CHAP domain-containing protein [Ruminococcus sp.]|nr:CHAP domain-containing protein [Ruminococcus sp.]